MYQDHIHHRTHRRMLAHMNAILNAIIVGRINVFKKSLSPDLKYSRDTETQGWTGDITYHINELK
jgi:hypothetical protein